MLKSIQKISIYLYLFSYIYRDVGLIWIDSVIVIICSKINVSIDGKINYIEIIKFRVEWIFDLITIRLSVSLRFLVLTVTLSVQGNPSK